MVISIVIGSVLVLAVLVSVGLLVRDMRSLRRSGKSLTGTPVEAGGVTAAGISFFSNNGTH